MESLRKRDCNPEWAFSAKIVTIPLTGRFQLWRKHGWPLRHNGSVRAVLDCFAAFEQGSGMKKTALPIPAILICG
jgi:hypothetical protein